MLNILIAAVLVPSAAEFFPLIEGTRWHYEQKVGTQVVMLVDEVLPGVEVGGKTATPIARSLNGHVEETLYYRVVDDTVFIVAYDPEKPLDDPLPVLKVGAGRVKWEHVGATFLAKASVPLSMSCESAPKGEREVLSFGKRAIVEMKVNALVGGSTVTGIRNQQTALYAKGIGLIESKGEGKIGSQKTKFECRLLKMEPGKGVAH